jgi:hypothetical protein
MTYVHLSNGQVREVENDDWIAESGSPNAFREGGMEYGVIGVYAKEVEHPASPEVQAEKDKEDAANRAEFDKWRASQSSSRSGSSTQGEKKL